MDEQLQLLIDSKFAELESKVTSQSTDVMAQVHTALNGFEAKQKRLSKAAATKEQPETQETEVANTYAARIQELETKLAEKEAAETQSKKAAAVSEYVSRHPYSEEFGEFYLLKYENAMNITPKGILVDGKPLEESLKEFAEAKGSAFTTGTLSTSAGEDGQNTLMHTETVTTGKFDAAAYLSTLS